MVDHAADDDFSPALGRQAWSNQSLPIVSAKRE